MGNICKSVANTRVSRLIYFISSDFFPMQTANLEPQIRVCFKQVLRGNESLSKRKK